jgi:uncharacterized protein YndB with AHSA1/START domain
MVGVERELVTASSPAEVWAALTRPERLSQWFGATVDIDARPGGRATFRWPDGRVRGAVVEAAVPERLLVLRWLPFEHDPSGRIRHVAGTEVRFRLRAHPGGTLMQVTEATPDVQMQAAGR